MISQLTSLLANATNAGAVSSNVSSSSANVSPSVPSTMPAHSLVQATALANAARVAVSRLPEQILSIQPLQSEKASGQTLTVSLPSNTTLRAFQNPQMVALPLPSSNTPVLLLTSTAIQQYTSSVPLKDYNNLMNAIAQSLSKNDAAICLKGRVTVLTSGQLGLGLSKENKANSNQSNVIPIPVTTQSDRKALQAYLGQQVSMTVSSTSSQEVALKLTPLVASDKTTKSASNIPLQTTTLKISSDVHTLKQHIIESGLTQGSVAIVLNKNTPALLHRVLPVDNKNMSNVLKSVALLGLKDGAVGNKLLTVHMAQNKAVLAISQTSSTLSSSSQLSQLPVAQVTASQVSVPQKAAAGHFSPTIPTLSAELVKNVSINALPKANIVELPSSTGESHIAQQTNSPTERTKATPSGSTEPFDPTTLKGSDVHQAIRLLSRVLLGQTGSTNQALSQLLTIVNNAETKKADGTHSDSASMEKVFRVLKSLDVSTIVPSKPIGKNGTISTASTATNDTSVYQTGRTLPNDSQLSISDILGTKVKKDVASPNLGALLNSLGLQAKNVSNDLLSAVKHQFTHVMKEALPSTNSVMSTTPYMYKNNEQSGVIQQNTASKNQTMPSSNGLSSNEIKNESSVDSKLTLSHEQKLVNAEVNQRSQPVITNKENSIFAPQKGTEVTSSNLGKVIENPRVNTVRTAETAVSNPINNAVTPNIPPTSDVDTSVLLSTAKQEVKQTMQQGQGVARAIADKVVESVKSSENRIPSNTAAEPEKSSNSQHSDHHVNQSTTENRNQHYSQNSMLQDLPSRLHGILTANALLTTPITLTSPANNSNFVQGLIALVQLALAGRAMQRQPSLKSFIDAPESVVSKTLSNIGSTAQPSRVAQDLSQLDSRQQLLSQLKTLLANHQQSKIANADSRIQGQDSFYYVLPSMSQYQSPTELLIHREQEKKHTNKKRENGRTLWNVTMKLDIGDTGQVLAKSRIDKSSITIDLYASNEVILRRIANTMPYLTRRLSSLGLEVEKSSFQRGHIPETLQTRPHQIFETRV